MQSADSPRREKQCLHVWRRKMERLIFGEFVKSAENPCRKRFEINPETSGRHISGTITDIATAYFNQVFRASQSTSLPLSILKASTAYFWRISAAFRDIFRKRDIN
jgi:hypothetical protein